MSGLRIEFETLEKIVREVLRVMEKEPELLRTPSPAMRIRSLTARLQDRLGMDEQDRLLMDSPMTEGEPIQVSTVRDLLLGVQSALQKGLIVISSDDPLRRLIGYQVLDAGCPVQYLHIGLAHVESTRDPKQLEGLGVDPALLTLRMGNPGWRVALIDILGGMSDEKALAKLARGTDSVASARARVPHP